jgi:acyl-lipid omega-6 desaturase (Delta-12 desaturase)
MSARADERYKLNAPTAFGADPRTWMARLAPYRQADNRRAIWEVAVTALPFAGLWIAMAILAQYSWWFAAALAIPTAGMMVRLFMIQHDCGHNAMFTSRRANDWMGRVLGVLTLTPYDFWRQSHALHHAGSGNLDRRGIGDIDTLTLAEYRARSWFGRLKYRCYRHPIVMFGIGPAYLFLLQQRLPVGAMTRGVMPWASTMSTNLAVVAVSAVLIWAMGFGSFLIVHLPVVLIGGSIGVWLFYVQHQFERTFWEHDPDWSHPVAALHGSSYYDLPKPLMWLTGNIGIHHLHHLSSRIPFYRLPQVLADHAEFKSIGRITLRQSLACVRLTLWDEEKKRLVPFGAK